MTVYYPSWEEHAMRKMLGAVTALGITLAVTACGTAVDGGMPYEMRDAIWNEESDLTVTASQGNDVTDYGKNETVTVTPAPELEPSHYAIMCGHGVLTVDGDTMSCTFADGGQYQDALDAVPALESEFGGPVTVIELECPSVTGWTVETYDNPNGDEAMGWCA